MTLEMLLWKGVLLELILKKLWVKLERRLKKWCYCSIMIVMDGQGAAFGSVLADAVTGQIRRNEIVYPVKYVLMNK